NTAKAHGEPLGAEEIALTRSAIGWRHEPFQLPEAVYEEWDARAKGDTLEGEWDKRFAAYRAAHPELAAEFARRMKGSCRRTSRRSRSMRPSRRMRRPRRSRRARLRRSHWRRSPPRCPKCSADRRT